MLKDKRLLIGYKILFGLLGIIGVVTEIIVLTHRGQFKPDNFFSFFTIESNLFAAIILIWSAWATWRGERTSRLDYWRGASTLYMVTTGIVFSVLLSGIDSRLLTAVPWDNTVLHYIIPVVVLVDWIIDRPKQPIEFKRATIWLIYPVLYLVYSLIRGHIVGWYPYPFLNPAQHGYVGVAITGVGVAIVVLLLTSGVTWLARKK